MPVTRALIVANIVVFALQAVWGDTMVEWFALWPLGRHAVPELHLTVAFHWWQLATSAFLHAGLLHIALNMWALYLFGHDVERTLGSGRYLVLYGAAVLSASVVQLVVVSATAESSVFPTVGASGGIFGLLLAFGVLFPRRVLMLIFPPIPLPAWLFVVLYGLLELTNGVLGTDAGVAHFAHLGGMLGAWLLLRRWRVRETYDG
ncbi:MAG TPA: rhomboid family intramembrane serine protease [Pseudomonadales bacterium]|nr:rhomboid family intramembrane serine protease [Pseudomonadales bacterium]